MNLPLHAPYHAPALFEQLDARKIALGRHARALTNVNIDESRHTLYSTSTGQPYSVTNVLDLFVKIIQEILSETLRWDRVLATFVSGSEANQSALATILAFGPTKAANSLVSRLQPKIGNSIVLHDASTWASRSQQEHSNADGNFRQSKLAVVGIAGRFPGSSNHEEFWELLEQGLDVHKEVGIYPCFCPRSAPRLIFFRYPAIDSMRKPMSTRMARSGTRVTHLTVASLITPATSTHASSICPHGKLHRQTLCSGLHSLPHMKLSKWRVTSQTGPHPAHLIESAHFTARRVTITARQMRPRM